MTPNQIPVRSVSMLECRNCGAGAPVDEHFCPSCSRILALGRHGDYFSFLGVPRRLNLDVQQLERNFRELSRKFHPDYYYNATSQERLASLERSSYLNDAYRALKNPVTRIEHLLAIEGLPPAKAEHPSGSGATATVPPALLEEVFALNEELDEIRDARESGADPERLRARLDAARAPIDRKREQHEAQVASLSTRWDEESPAATPDRRRAILEELRAVLLERNYINNLIATIDREVASTGSGQAAGSGNAERLDESVVRRPTPDAHG
ncbi:MAG TPA: Fe-S protein assembly co-chaperone HscB [Vicinamibacterales bacterium]|nr:Fe-S protein assembly co-chaperone HscB [Vicinamibacterales bacterium]